MRVKILKSNIRIGEITSSAEYRMDEQFQNLPIFGINFWFSKLVKKFQKVPKFYNFENYQISIPENSKNRKIYGIFQFRKIVNFQNVTI